MLETVIIRALAAFGVVAGREPGYTGVWVPGVPAAKIAAIGVKVNVRGITSHGSALNVAPDLRYFEWIVPCGIVNRHVTSLAKVLGRPVSSEVVARRLAAAFAQMPGPGGESAPARAQVRHSCIESPMV